MKTSDAGITLICEFEGFSPVIYKDVAGLDTIGYGHLLRAGEVFNRISEEEAKELLQKDLCTAESAVTKLITAPLSQKQFDALVSFTFNLGSGTLQNSTLRQKLNRQQYADAPTEIKRFVYAGGKMVKGLVIRREAEATMFAS